MWPFDRKKRRVDSELRRFASYLSPDVVKVLADGSPREPAFERGEIPFALLQVRDDNAEHVDKHLARAMARVRESGGVSDMMSSFVFVIFGFPRGTWASVPERPSIENGRRLSAALLQDMGSDVRVLYGTATGLVGNLGGSHFLHYGAAIPNFGALMTKLVQLEFGRMGVV